ncbi:hypothetical protein ACFL9T_10570 [Thermodesulfobacteriota bacterium]
MLTKIQKWGNSQVFRLDKSMLEDAQLGVAEDTHSSNIKKEAQHPSAA